MIPKAEVRFVDMWQVSGLRGTGSFSFQVDDLFVPKERTYDPNAVVTTGGPLYIVPRTLLFGSGVCDCCPGRGRQEPGNCRRDGLRWWSEPGPGCSSRPTIHASDNWRGGSHPPLGSSLSSGERRIGVGLCQSMRRPGAPANGSGCDWPAPTPFGCPPRWLI